VSPDQLHRCTVQRRDDGSPFLAFEPSSGRPSSYSNSLFTLDLLPGATMGQARDLCAHVNTLLKGVSATIF
jgi:hypothetical protein